MNDKTFWIVGKEINQENGSWEFQGLFSSEEKAVDACRDDHYFVGPALLDESLPHESVDWAGSYYPLLTPKF